MSIRSWLFGGVLGSALSGTVLVVSAQESIPADGIRGASLPPAGTIVPDAAPKDAAPKDAASAVPASSTSDAPCCNGFDFKKVPPVRIFPRPGDFPIPPTGCGYYSLVDHWRGEQREKAPKFGYPPFALMPPSFFDADWRYLDDPKNKDHSWSDPLHRIHLGENFLFNTGGQVWWRHMSEFNSRLTQNNNEYDLFRARVYADLWYQDKARVFVEFINAQSFNQDLAPLPIDRNFGDLLNAFVDVKLPIGCCDDHPAYLRVGRQELLLGSQRLISTLDWANTRRTFDGVRAFRQGEKFDVDIFWVQPVIPVADRFDSRDQRQNFGGVWTTYRPEKGQFMDFYVLHYDNSNTVNQRGIRRYPASMQTVGCRYAGDKNQWLWDVEGAVQFGDASGRDLCAGMATLGGGYHFKNLPLNPIVWAYYDYASGDKSPNVGTYQTFNQLFPFGHYYMGWGDWIGRQNIQDFNAHLFLYPTNYITLWMRVSV